MTKEEYNLMEVKPADKGWYFVTLYQFKKAKPEYPDYFKDWISFDGENWDYMGVGDSCYVCFINKKELLGSEK